ncbi:hypothetical protein Tco_1377942 [Tanacetum coccineum]
MRGYELTLTVLGNLIDSKGFYLVTKMGDGAACGDVMKGASCIQGTVSSIPIVGSISPEGFLSLILLLVVIIATVVVTVVVVVAIVGVVIVVAVIRVVLVVSGVSFIIKLSFMVIGFLYRIVFHYLLY